MNASLSAKCTYKMWQITDIHTKFVSLREAVEYVLAEFITEENTPRELTVKILQNNDFLHPTYRTMYVNLGKNGFIYDWPFARIEDSKTFGLWSIDFAKRVIVGTP